MKLKRILILEDDLKTLSVLLNKLSEWEDEKDFHLAVTIFSESSRAQKFIESANFLDFDVILLDRDCKEFESFHKIDLDKLDKSKIISISSVPPYNENAKNMGVEKVVLKDYMRLSEFVENVIGVMDEMV